MERLGILELTEIAGLAPVEDWDALRGAEGTPFDAAQGDYFAFRTLIDNDFGAIPEGFTGLYYRDMPYQIVPDALVYKIKEMSLGGFRHIPEDHELHLWIDPTTELSAQVVEGIANLLTEWMDFNFNP